MKTRNLLDEDAFKRHRGLRHLIFQYLPANTLYHKIALLSKQTRQELL
jgi:hypothetical protein